MDAYKSYIDGHLISCKPFPGDGGESLKNLLPLIRRPMQGTGFGMPLTKTVEVNGDQQVFTLQGLEYFNGKLSLTNYLLLQINIGDKGDGVKVKIY